MTTRTTQDAKGSLTGVLGPLSARAEADLERWLVEPDTPETLADAMRYCVLGGGKRLRPALVYLCAAASGGKDDAEAARGERHVEAVGRAAVAVELVHAYSLVHDDLPAMDDDVLRRGRPTAHVKFGQAMAILAGDALLTRAFGVLGELDHPSAAALVAELARGAGAAGMVAGQVADMDLCTLPAGLAGLEYIHRNKTGALIRAAARMGAIAASGEPVALHAVTIYAEKLGLAFQLQDDLLDVTGSAADLGKTPGKDQAAGKRTFIRELGIDAARQRLAELTRSAADALEPLGRRGGDLARLAELLSERTH